MLSDTVLIILLILSAPALCFLYFISFQIAIRSAIKENNGEKFFNRLYILFAVIVALGAIYFVKFGLDSMPVHVAAAVGVFYLVLEIPYQLVKYAAKAMVDELIAVNEDKREAARLKQAQTLAAIIEEKLNISCELQAFSHNEEFIFLTYILKNKPIATRLKLNQADKAESWKKLGEWLITNYQKELSSN